ncbi:MAG TPA: GH92 family glycosyl hydrolase [Dongiaceae bacterium]|nr:GH92 family glycosyl hydrolase [Dongiaceae bacterium]
MKRYLPSAAFSCLGAVFLLATATCDAESPADYVNPFIGTAEHGHVYPGATVPFGMVQLSPDTRDTTWDGCSGYHYSDTSIMGFSHNHLTGTGCADLGNFLLMPTVGELKMDVGSKPGEGYRARFSHDQEEAHPGYYRVFLPDNKINVELTATARAGLHRYTFPQSDAAHVILDLRHGIDNKPLDSALTIENDHTVSGFRRSDGWGGDKVYYFVMEFSRPFTGSGILSSDTDVAGQEAHGKNLKAHFDFKTQAGDQILVKVGISSVSVTGARQNLAQEIPGWRFDAIRAAAEAQWNAALDVVKIKTADENLKHTFYTAVYHTLLAPTILSDVDGQYRGPDKEVHVASGYDFYTELSLWDTFRAENPLLTLIQPGRVNDFVRTMLDHCKYFDQHTLPVWTEGGKENWCMIGNHAIPIIVDAYNKGFRNWNAKEALDDMIGSVDKNRAQLGYYRDRGYIPSRKGVQSVSKVLEYCYDDACIARFAKQLGESTAAATSAKRAQNWRNVFDPETGFMRGKLADGSWRTPFDPKFISFDDYTEANAWQYTFFVPHDVSGLIAAMGGDDKFVARLDEMFDTKEKIPNSLSDVSGLIGMYAHGNEPCHHVAYLYNYAGQPWKTQARIRQVASSLYDSSNGGLCGNDDCGQTSAWYVFSALGFYPVDPASSIYVIGSPLVSEATLSLDTQYYRGHKFTMIAKNNSPQNVYVQSATLNGKALDRTWLSHDDIAAGGTLVLVMGPQPNKSWGTAAAARPPEVK